MNQIIQRTNFSNTEINAELQKLQFELEGSAQVQAKHDAQQGGVLTQSLYEIRLLKTIIVPKVQSCISSLREKLLVAAKVVGVQQLEIVSRKTIEKARRDINEKEIAVIEAHKDGHQHYVPSRKTRLKKILNIAGFIIAGIDAAIAYGSFRTGSYSTIQAGALALGVFSLIYFATNLIAPWVKSGTTKLARNLRAIGVCIIVFFVFLGISILRAEGLNNFINVAVDASNQPQANYSPLPILFVSYGLFLCMFLIHQFYYQSEEEKNIEKQKQLQYQTLKQLESEIERLNTEIKLVEKELLEKKNEVRELYDYFHKLVLKAKHIGTVAVGIYKRTYSLYSSNIPDFFHEKQQIDYDTEIAFSNP